MGELGIFLPRDSEEGLFLYVIFDSVYTKE